VYRATNVSLGRKVAIKLLSPELVHIEDDVLRFLREARAAAAVRHTNVVDVLDVARDDDGTPFIVQELLSGEDLEQHLSARGGRLSYDEALEIMIPVADAVAAAHAQDVVHRDLKPANIFLARDRNKITPKVLDFGACLFPTLAERTAKEMRMLLGTPHYMAPEQIVSKAEVDARSDVWALGIILYELVVGETPFEADSTDAVLHLVKTRKVPLLRERMKDAPAELEELIARCTTRDRLARLPNAAAVHEQMELVHRSVRSGRSPVVRPKPEVADGERPLTTTTSTPSAKRNRLLTLNSPSDIPPADDDLDLDLPLPPTPFTPPATSERRRKSSAPPAAPPIHREPTPIPDEMLSLEDAPSLGTMRSFGEEPSSGGDSMNASDGMRELEPDESGPIESLDLAARPSSWPPPASLGRPSSLPPVLDPRAAAPASKSAADRAPRDAGPVVIATAGPAPAAHTKKVDAQREPTWSRRENLRFAATVAVPAFVAFVVVLVVPPLAAPVARALRGDSMVASAVLAVIALVSAIALCARALLGERDRWVSIAAGASVLFGIAMIIVTFSASDAAELGVPSSMAGLSTVVAPLAPLALALGALGRARAAWLDVYSRGEALRFAALASVMLFLSLTVSPLGPVRTAPRAVQTSHVSAAVDG
jgi:serine/threonine-protein kinase